MTERALVIKGPLRDLENVLAIARSEGAKVLRTKHVRVKPFVASYGNSDYLVVIEPEMADCLESSVPKTGKQLMNGP